jgi:hypothetical protein
MKTSISIIILTIGLTCYSCERNDLNTDYPFEAEVVGQSMSCGEFEIRFTKDLDKVIKITGESPYSNCYNAKNLPVELKEEGLIITLNFRKIGESELGICNTYGPSYPWLYVTYAKLK